VFNSYGLVRIELNKFCRNSLALSSACTQVLSSFHIGYLRAMGGSTTGPSRDFIPYAPALFPLYAAGLGLVVRL
jgi:hypothetical protein